MSAILPLFLGNVDRLQVSLVQQVARPFLDWRGGAPPAAARASNNPMGAFPLPGLRSWGTDGTLEKPAWTATHRPDGE
jgi:hypothetical protein